MKNKNDELTMVRAICVLLVITIHLLPNLYDSTIYPFFGYTLGTFFFLSGYFLKVTPVIEQLRRRMTKLVRPFLFYFVSVALIGGLLLELTQGMTFSEWGRSVVSELLGKEFLNLFSPDLYLKSSLHRPMTVMWFFIQLMLATLFAIPVLNVCKDSKQEKFLFALVAFGISALLYTLFERCPLQAQMLFFEIGIMLCGNIARQVGFLEKDHFNKMESKILFLFVGAGFIAMLYFANPGFTYMSSGKIGSTDNIIDVVMATVHSLLGTLWMYELCTILKKVNIIKRALCYVGINSQEYVYMHLIIGWLLTFVGVPIGLDYVKTDAFTGSAWQVLMLIGIFIVNIILCTLYTKLLAKIKASTKSAFIKDI